MSDRKRGGGLDFFDVLTLIFITLKLCGKINWSWWRVLSPLLIEAGIVLVILAIRWIMKGEPEHKKEREGE